MPILPTKNVYRLTKRKCPLIKKREEVANILEKVSRMLNAKKKYFSHNMEDAERSIGYYENANKTRVPAFKQERAIYKSNDKHLKLVEHFAYLGINISTGKRDANECMGKAWTDIDRLSTI